MNISRLLRFVACPLAITAALAGGASAAVSQEIGDDGAPVTEVEAVTVEGRRLADQVRDFVGEVAAAPRGRLLARWDGRVCVGVMNLTQRHAQFMIDRVALRAVEIGLEPGEPGCRPDIMIIGAADANQLARDLVRDSPSGFRPARGGTDLGSAALRRFQNSDDPVRWWHVSVPVSVDTGEIAVALSGEEPPTVNVRDASRLRSNVRDEMKRAVIILDTSRIGAISFGALSDYVAMIALAQVDPRADTASYPSILNLFNDIQSGAEPPDGLTDWDRNYLAGLYAAREDRLRQSQQERAITQEILNAPTRTQEQ